MSISCAACPQRSSESPCRVTARSVVQFDAHRARWEHRSAPDTTSRGRGLTTRDVLELAKAEAETPSAHPLEGIHVAPFTVWFNAWKYESTNEVWAGLADAILHQVADQLPPRERETFWLRLNFRRIDPDRVRQRIHERIFTAW